LSSCNYKLSGTSPTPTAPLALGVDLGTTGTRASVVDPATGAVVGDAHVPTRLIRTDDAVVQDPAELLASVEAAIRAAVAQAPGPIAGLAIGGQMAGVMGLDRDGLPTTPYDSWLDARCGDQLGAVRAHGQRLIERTGCPPMVDHLPKLLWWREHEHETYARTARWVQPAAYAALRLCGGTSADAFIDETYLHFTGLADVRNGTWAPDLLDAFGVEETQLPRIVTPTDRVGALTREAADRCGLPADLPVFAGAGDTASGALGAGIVAPGELLDTAGTAAVLLGAVPGFAADPAGRLITMRGALPGQFLTLSYVGGAGLCLPWLTRVLGAPGADERERLEALIAEAADVPAGAEGLFFVPHLDGRILPAAPDASGAWLGLRFRHERGHLTRAVLEAVAFEYRGYLEAMRAAHPGFAPASLRSIGGGARSATWNAIKGDALGVPVGRVAREELGAYGCALIAAAGAGALEDLAAAAACAPTGTRAPDAAAHATYSDLWPRYAATVEHLITDLEPAS